MKQTRNWILAAMVAVACNLPATEWFVDRTRPDDSGNGKSVEAAKRTIQAAVSAAAAGDVVTVLPGVYDEGGNTFTASSVVSSNRVYILKNLTLRSRDGAAVTHIVGAKDLNVATNASPNLGDNKAYYFGFDAIVLEPIRPTDATFLFVR